MLFKRLYNRYIHIVPTHTYSKEPSADLYK